MQIRATTHTTYAQRSVWWNAACAVMLLHVLAWSRVRQGPVNEGITRVAGHGGTHAPFPRTRQAAHKQTTARVWTLLGAINHRMQGAVAILD